MDSEALSKWMAEQMDATADYPEALLADIAPHDGKAQELYADLVAVWQRYLDSPEGKADGYWSMVPAFLVFQWIIGQEYMRICLGRDSDETPMERQVIQSAGDHAALAALQTLHDPSCPIQPMRAALVHAALSWGVMSHGVAWLSKVREAEVDGDDDRS